ncbi:Serine incorporator/TMS membrane protein [Trinorchestia longiramus]|nr:Serine incorporator/TMS membrane protein [Trinorchestia longiramus]
MASAKIEARTNIKFMVKLGWKNSQIIDSLEQVYGDNAPKKSATYKWINRFRSGRNETEDDPRSGRPCTSVCVENIDAVRDLIEKDRRIITESVADTLNISVGSALTILVDSLGLSKLSARWVPRLLRPDQQESRADLSMEILNKWDENPELFLQRIVTGDETWLYQYDPEDKTQSKQWLPRDGNGPAKAKSERSREKCKCLCGGGACRLCCRWCPRVRESTSTRAAYIFFLLLSIVVMILMMSNVVQKFIMTSIMDRSTVCKYIGAGEKCEEVLGYMAVYRLGLAIVVYHLLLSVLTFRAKESKGCRAAVHNGMWFYKVMLMLGLIVAVFVIPDPYEYFIQVWMYVAMVGAGIFIVIQLILIVFMVHGWSDSLVRRVNDGGSLCCWYGVVVGGVTMVSYILCIAAAVLLYYYFAWDRNCHKNQWFILVNLCACFLVTVVAGCKKSKSTLMLRFFQSSLICLYVQYLTWTAISSAPRSFQDDIAAPIIGSGRWASNFNTHSFHQRFYCGPGKDEMMWTDSVMPYISIFIMIVTVVNGSMGAAEPDSCNALKFPDCPISDQPQDVQTDDSGGQKLVRNEKSGLAYSYPLFHIMLALASLFMMMSLTGWYTPQKANLVTFGRSWASVWIKMVSSWICLIIYLFTTLFPSIVPKRYQPLLEVTQATVLSRSPSRASCYSDYRSAGGYGGYPLNDRNGSTRSVGQGYFGSTGSLSVGERLRRYSQSSQYVSHHSSLDAVPLAPSERAPTIVCHQETTV